MRMTNPKQTEIENKNDELKQTEKLNENEELHFSILHTITLSLSK
jgi:hypothetical protein